MREYGENKIFVEGKSDKSFIDFLLKKFYNIADTNIVIDVEGKDKLEASPLLANERRRDEKAKNLIIFDTDFENDNSKGGREKRLENLKKIENLLKVKFDIFLLPFNDESEGVLEDLFKTCFKSDLNFFDYCWNTMIECIKNEKIENLNIPAQKAFIYSKFDLFRFKGNLKKEDKPYQFEKKEIWNFDRNKNKELNKLLEFIENNLFENE